MNTGCLVLLLRLLTLIKDSTNKHVCCPKNCLCQGLSTHIKYPNPNMLYSCPWECLVMNFGNVYSSIKTLLFLCQGWICSQLSVCSLEQAPPLFWQWHWFTASGTKSGECLNVKNVYKASRNVIIIEVKFKIFVIVSCWSGDASIRFDWLEVQTRSCWLWLTSRSSIHHLATRSAPTDADIFFSGHTYIHSLEE